MKYYVHEAPQSNNKNTLSKDMSDILNRFSQNFNSQMNYSGLNPQNSNSFNSRAQNVDRDIDKNNQNYIQSFSTENDTNKNQNTKTENSNNLNLEKLLPLLPLLSQMQNQNVNTLNEQGAQNNKADLIKAIFESGLLGKKTNIDQSKLNLLSTLFSTFNKKKDVSTNQELYSKNVNNNNEVQRQTKDIFTDKLNSATLKRK